MESVLGRRPGAEDFLADGPPWWFGFHSAAPGLAETPLEGREAACIDWFLRAGTLGDGVRPALRDAFVRAYTGRERVTLAAGVEVLPVITQGWQIYFVARYIIDA